MPLISVVIPAFNRADVIGCAIESCLAQTHQDIEIVVVNDASSDDLKGALRPFAENPRVRLVEHERNQGVSAARNTGVRTARGAFVAFLDSDDEWLPTKLEKQLRALSCSGVERTICVTLVRVELDHGADRIRPDRRKPDGMPFGDYLFLENGFAQTSSFFLSRRLALATPFRAKLQQYEDYAFLIDLGAKGVKCIFVEEPLTIWRDDDRPGRLGARDDVCRGMQFLREVGEALSPQAQLAFEATHLAHLRWPEHPWRVLAIVLRALRRRAISPKSAIGILSRSILGQNIHKALRHAIMRWWARVWSRRGADSPGGRGKQSYMSRTSDPGP